MSDTEEHRRAVIEKLERLAESSTFSGEAEAAREKAKAMRVRYGIFTSVTAEVKSEAKVTDSRDVSQKPEPPESAETFSMTFRISRISEEDMEFYLRAIEETLHRPMKVPGMIEWNAEIVTKRSFMRVRKSVTMLVRFSSKSMETVRAMKDFFMAFGELEISRIVD